MTGVDEFPGVYPRPDLPRLSLSERDRRWARIRSLMAERGLDAIIALSSAGNWAGGNANARYLSSIGGNFASVSVVFPHDGEVTVIAGPVPMPDFWQQAQDWVTDVRPSFFAPVPGVVERLRELHLDRGRIGVAGLAGVAREPGGLVSVGNYQMLCEGLPGAELVNATDLLDRARFVKGDEEIGMLRTATSMIEPALDVLEAETRPGTPEHVVYARVMAALLERGSEPSTMFLWTAGRPLPPTVATLPSARPLQRDDVILVEIDARWCGYLGHVALTCWVGEPDEIEREMSVLQLEATRRCQQALTPGAVLGDLVAVCEEVARGSGFVCEPIVHSRGLGMDAPVLVRRIRDEQTAQWPIEANSAFAVKPVVTSRDGQHKIMWGDSVVVTAGGAERLGRRIAPGERWL